MSANVESRGLIHKGDMTTTGGVVTQGVGHIMFVGCGVTHIGMIATCPSCKKGQGPITPIVNIPVLVDGVQAALHGDIVACGCPPGSNTLIASPTAMSFRNENGVITSHRPFVSTAELDSVYSEAAAMAGVRYEPIAQKKAVPQNGWKPVKAQFPLLVFRSNNEMDDFDAPDMTYGNESRSVIESYGLMQPFKNKMRYSPSMGYDVVSEDQFNLPASEHFKRLRSLGDNIYGSGLGFSTKGNTKNVFFEMVDKFKRDEGGYFESPELTLAMKNHETTAKFHKELLKCLSDNLSDGVLHRDILSVVIKYMNSDIKGEGAPLPQFIIKNKDGYHKDLFNGGVLSVHGIWSMEVYVDSLEYKGSSVRGKFRYKIQDHFGLDSKDINHSSINNPFELINGFRSWYLLQHFELYGYKPFITKIEFNYE